MGSGYPQNSAKTSRGGILKTSNTGANYSRDTYPGLKKNWKQDRRGRTLRCMARGSPAKHQRRPEPRGANTQRKPSHSPQQNMNPNGINSNSINTGNQQPPQQRDSRKKPRPENTATYQENEIRSQSCLK